MNPKFVLDVFPVGSTDSYESESESPPPPLLELPVGLVLPNNPKRPITSISKVVEKKFRNSTAQSSDIPVEKDVVVKKRCPEEIHYEYLKLIDIIHLYPLSEKKYVSVYGIILSYDKHKETMVILDETFDNFAWFPNIRSSSLTFKTGDIIRVHRLLLEVNKTRHSINQRNIVIFESFSEEIFKPQSLAAKPTFEDYDNCRVEELTKLNTKYLIEEPIIKTINDFCTIQSAFLVFNVHDDEALSRTIICCWSPHDLFAGLPCKPLNSLEQLLENIQIESSIFPLSNDLIRKFYIKQRLIFIKVYGPHRLQAKSLKAFDIAVVFNLLRDKDRLWKEKYSYKLSDQEKHGQCIRQASNKSHLAEEFRKQIMDYLGDEEKLKQLDSAPDYLDETLERTCNSLKKNTEQISKKKDLSKVPIFKDEGEIREKHTSRNSFNSSIMTPSDDGSTDRCDRNDNPSLWTVDAVGFIRQFSFDQIHIIEELFPNIENDNDSPYEDVWPKYESIRCVKNLRRDTIFVLKATFSTFYGRTVNGATIFDDINILRPLAMILECTRPECGLRMAFETEKTEIHRGFIKCPNCSHCTCNVFLDLNLILQDKYQNDLDVRWTGLNANHFFKCNIEDLADPVISVKFASKLKAIIQFLLGCYRNGFDIHWKLHVKDDDQQKEFQIIDAKLTVNHSDNVI